MSFDAEKMIASRVAAFGGPENLAPVSCDIPSPTSNELLIRVTASAAMGGSLMLASLGASVFGSRKAHFAASGGLKHHVRREMYRKLVEFVEADKFAPIIDRTYPLDELVEAHRYVETGHKRGNVVFV